MSKTLKNDTKVKKKNKKTPSFNALFAKILKQKITKNSKKKYIKNLVPKLLKHTKLFKYLQKQRKDS